MVRVSVSVGRCRASAVASRRQAVGAARVLMIAGLMAAFAAPAADELGHNRFEITPFGGYAFGGDFEDPTDASERSLDEDTSFGLFFDIADDPWRHYEFVYSRQSTELDGAVPFDMDVQYLQVGGTVSHPDARYVIPYFGLTVGAARFSPDETGLGDTTKLSFSVGGGAKVPFTDHFGLRFDIRAFLTVLDEDADLFCGSNPPAGTCRIIAKSDTFLQYAASLGVTFGF